jgi:predicted small metal-binding protein
MTFTLACADVMPGCAARFEDTDKDALMRAVGAHATTFHGIRTFSPEILAVVDSRIVSA